MRELKVLHIIEQLGIGGAEKQLLGMLERLDHDRFASTVCYFNRLPDSLEERFRACGVRVVFIDKHGQSTWGFFRALRRAIRDVSPDVVHTWMYSANFWGRWAAVSCGVRALAASQRSEVQTSRLIDRVSEWLLRRRTLWLANSRTGADSMERHYGIRARDVRIIHNAVELAPCDGQAARHEIRRELGTAQGCRLVIMVARLRREKNYPMFVRVAGRVCRQRPDVVLAGIGARDRIRDLEPLIESLGVADRVRFPGECHDVHRWLAAADVFCFTSNYEGFPNAVLEAMLAGLPVVSTAFASVSEVLPDAACGVKVPLDDDERMASEIIRLLDDADLRRRLGEGAQRFVSDRFTWRRLVETMEQLYRDLACGQESC